MLFAHVVAHTHWDREWYQPFVRFRQQLIALIDELLDDPPPPGESFLLDGQAVVVEDYLDVRPERATELAALLRSGRLEAGPWYVLADELIPGGEAIVRNLLLGRRILRRLGASSPPVLYCPDSFGHPAALPMIAVGFGLPLVILWRGFGGASWPAGDTVRWTAPDGSNVVLHHLPPNGYEFASDLPLAAGPSAARWRAFRAELAPRSRTGIVLLPNGADHHARQRGQADAVRLLAAAAATTDDAVVPSSLSRFATELLAAADHIELPTVSGELRDSYGYTWTLQGTFATRAMQKRRSAIAERLLVRDAEPWAALAHRAGAAPRSPVLTAAWRTLLQSHPHDTLCGCSIDEVANAMDLRVADATTQAIGIRDDSIADLIGHDPEAARSKRAEWSPVVLVRNRAARPRGGVAIVELKEFLADVPVGPGSASAKIERAEPAAVVHLDGLSAPQILGGRVTGDRVLSPRHYPDQDMIASTRAAVWVPLTPGYGISAFPFDLRERSTAQRPGVVRATESSLDNGLVRIGVSRGGRVSLRSGDGRRNIDDLVAIEDRVDRGDLYTPSIRGVATTQRLVSIERVHTGPLIGELRIRWALQAPGRRRASRLEVRLRLVAESPLVHVSVRGVNRLRDHRLRVGFRTNIAPADVWADAAFGALRRSPLRVPEEDTLDELPPPTAPLQRYVSLFAEHAGFTLFSDGLAEYEASAGGELWVTLLRAVGELSKNNLPERPGHAGWPAPTPKAQSLGPFSARFAVMLHGARDEATVDEIERAADDALLPLEGRTLRSALGIPRQSFGVELAGAGLAFSSFKPSEDGAWIVARCMNLLHRNVEGEWRLGTPIREACLARLDETQLSPLAPSGNTVSFVAPPRATVTVLLR